MSKYDSSAHIGGPTAIPGGEAHPRLYLQTPVARAIVLLLWLLYTIYPGSNPPPELSGPWTALLEIVPGVLGVGVLLLAGLTLADCALQAAPISKRGLAVLGGITLLLALILPAGNWVGPSAIMLLVYAPLSGITQELFFRGVLLPALLKALGNRLWLALSAQAVLFALWHLRTFMAVSQPFAIVAMSLTFLLAGIGWGWQVHHDRTLVWAMAHHSLLLMAMSLFGLVST